MIIVPAFIVGIGIGPTLLGYFTMSIVCSLTISITFQLAHVVEETQFEQLDQGTDKIKTPRALTQVESTINFSNNNKILTWYMGGLNFQLFHHLLPKVSHVHYPDLIPLMDKVFEKHNLHYKNISFLEALHSHFKFLDQRGKQLM